MIGCSNHSHRFRLKYSFENSPTRLFMVNRLPISLPHRHRAICCNSCYHPMSIVVDRCQMAKRNPQLAALKFLEKKVEKIDLED